MRRPTISSPTPDQALTQFDADVRAGKANVRVGGTRGGARRRGGAVAGRSRAVAALPMAGCRWRRSRGRCWRSVRAACAT